MHSSKKKVLAISGSTRAESSNLRLLKTLADSLQLLISFVRAKLDANGGIKDRDTLKAVEQVMNAFIHALNTSDSVPEL